MESGIGFRLYGCKDLAVDFYQGLAGKRGVADAQAVVSLSGFSMCMAHMRGGVIKKLYLRLRETSAQQLL
jgi:hypothetical protein